MIISLQSLYHNLIGTIIDNSGKLNLLALEFKFWVDCQKVCMKLAVSCWDYWCVVG